MDDKNRAADIKVGAFVLTALALLVVGWLWIAGSTLFGAQRVSYSILMKDSGGLQAGDRVRFAGVAVGRIQHVGLRPGEEWPVVLRVALKADVPVKTDSLAHKGTSGLLGSSFLQIEAGSATAQRLPAGGEIHGTSSVGMEDALARVDEISDKAMGLLDQTASLLDTVSGEIGPILSNLQMLLSETNSENLERILSGLRATAEDASPRVASLLERLESIARKFEGGVEGLPELTAELSGLVDDVHTALGPDGARLARVLETAESSLGSADQAFSLLGGNRAEIEATLRDLRDTVANLKAFSQQVKERPFSLVRIKTEPERQPGDGVKE